MQIQPFQTRPAFKQSTHPQVAHGIAAPSKASEPTPHFGGRSKTGPFKFIALMILGAAGALTLGKIKPPKKRFFQ